MLRYKCWWIAQYKMQHRPTRCTFLKMERKVLDTIKLTPVATPDNIEAYRVTAVRNKKIFLKTNEAIMWKTE